MARRWARSILVAVACAAVGMRAMALQLEPVVTSGLASPVFVTSARDGSARLYIVERGGRVLVFALGAPPTTFLDLSASVVAGGERGLLGLAFHPAYASSGRFFVYYTRAGDGALVIAEHQRSADPDVAQPGGRVLLTIAHPGQSNHNGGMLAFGQDGYLYIGVGDGGGANDPPNNAQNADQLLGKILRIDVDRSDPAVGTPYAAPADNPFVGMAGRDEIFATGMRNPWRFAFDRANGQLWVADVGQASSEEVDAPIERGGNYGWRVYEGTRCTNNDAALCNPGAYVPPLFEYAHTLGRCSITGGYVYRGARGTLAPGTYVFADFCTGEIFGWDGVSQRLLLDTTLALVSFGEDEGGELYAVDLDGAVYRLVPDAPLTAASAIEYVHSGFGHYFTTASVDEIEKLDAGVFAGWARTGESFHVSPAGTPGLADVCRFFSASFAPKSSHFYTPLAAECEIVKGKPEWRFEGAVYALALADGAGACPGATQPLYRLYNDGQGAAPNHRYTTRADIRDAMLAQGWVPEGSGVGVIGCVPP
jgi:glucose/arabinose dehydrogenase